MIGLLVYTFICIGLVSDVVDPLLMTAVFMAYIYVVIVFTTSDKVAVWYGFPFTYTEEHRYIRVFNFVIHRPKLLVIKGLLHV